MSSSLEQFPIRLRYYRVLRGWTQGELARAAGLPQSSVSFFETSRRAPSVESLVRLADALGVGVDALLGRGGTAPGEVTPIAREVLAAAEREGGVAPEAAARLARAAVEAEARRSREGEERRREREAAVRREEGEAVSRLREAAERARGDPVAWELLRHVLERFAACLAEESAAALTGGVPPEGRGKASDHVAPESCAVLALRRAVEALEARLGEREGEAGGAFSVVPAWADRGREEGWLRWVGRLAAALGRKTGGRE